MITYGSWHIEQTKILTRRELAISDSSSDHD